MASGNYTTHSPLTSITDAATANPWAAIRFDEWVDRFMKHPDPDTEQKIRLQLEGWIANDPKLETLIQSSPDLHSVKPLAQSLVTLSKIGLQALDYIDRDQPAPRAWARQTTTDFLQAREPAAATKLRMVDAVEQLVVTALKGRSGGLETARGEEKGDE